MIHMKLCAYKQKDVADPPCSLSLSDEQKETQKHTWDITEWLVSAVLDKAT